MGTEPMLEGIIKHLQVRDVRIRALLRPEMKELSKLLDKHKVPYKILPAPFFHVVVADWERTLALFGQVKDSKVLASTLYGVYIPFREFNAMIEMQFKLLWRGDFLSGFFDKY